MYSTKIIRRRMALLISEWVGVKCSESSRPKVYEILLSLLTPLDARNDVVVRMSAASALRYAVDEWNFKPDDFLPYLDAFLVGMSAEQDEGGIIGLMAHVKHIEARMKLIGVVEVIVERMDRRVLSILRRCLLLDHPLCFVNHESPTLFMGTNSRATYLSWSRVEHDEDINWGMHTELINLTIGSRGTEFGAPLFYCTTHRSWHGPRPTCCTPYEEDS